MRRRDRRAAFDAAQIERAAYFTACRFLGRGRYERRECPTLDAARAQARAMKAEGDGRGVMLYAVTPEGWTIHVENI